MTTNNVKAPRPCTTLPEGWVLNSKGLAVDTTNSLQVVWDRDDDLELTVRIISSSMFTYAYVMVTAEDNDTLLEILPSRLYEAYRAIANAQRPWLKAEGFEFVEGEVYWVMHKYDKTYLLCKFDNKKFYPAWSNGDVIETEEEISIYYKSDIASFHKSDILAFKPISDSQEAWDAVEKVERWEG
jgi:hypothetical protein